MARADSALNVYLRKYLSDLTGIGVLVDRVVNTVQNAIAAARIDEVREACLDVVEYIRTILLPAAGARLHNYIPHERSERIEIPWEQVEGGPPPWSDEFVKSHFRFVREEVDILMDVLDLTNHGDIVLDNGSRWEPRACFLHFCYRLSFPGRLKECVALFGGDESVSSRAFNWMVTYLYTNYAVPCLTAPLHLWKPRMARYAYAIGARTPLPHCWGFIDGKFLRTRRTVRFQRAIWSGHKRGHGLQYQVLLKQHPHPNNK